MVHVFFTAYYFWCTIKTNGYVLKYLYSYLFLLNCKSFEVAYDGSVSLWIINLILYNRFNDRYKLTGYFVLQIFKHFENKVTNLVFSEFLNNETLLETHSILNRQIVIKNKNLVINEPAMFNLKAFATMAPSKSG